jgi:hypothetical protein
MSKVSNFGQRITAVNDWKLKGAFLALLGFTAFLAFVNVRASTPSPFTYIYPFTTRNSFPAVCSPSNGADVLIAYSFWNISAGHSGTFIQPTFTSTFNVSSATNPSYTIETYGNTSLWGSYTGYAQPNGLHTTTTYGLEVSNFYTLAFFSIRHAGPYSENFTIEISTAPGQIVCAQNTYINAAVIYS